MPSKVILFKSLTMTVILSCFDATAFTVSIKNVVKQHVRSINSHPNSSLKRPATIFGWDDESSSYTSTFDEPSHDILEGYDVSSRIFASIADSISRRNDKTASLARLAVAFSPPEQSITLEDITQIQVVQVSCSHIELSVIVCDEVQCATILVPVLFQHDCSGCSDSEACVLNNIDKLDVEAQQLLNQRSLGSPEEERELLQSLNDNSNIQYPSWWISPQTSEISTESQHITNTLNQDGFQNQIQALARKGLEMTQDGHLFEIKRAVVCSIGPAGFFFRAIAVQKDDISKRFTILEIPLKFNPNQSSTVVVDSATLRSAVLGVVSSIF